MGALRELAENPRERFPRFPLCCVPSPQLLSLSFNDAGVDRVGSEQRVLHRSGAEARPGGSAEAVVGDQPFPFTSLVRAQGYEAASVWAPINRVISAAVTRRLPQTRTPHSCPEPKSR